MEGGIVLNKPSENFFEENAENISDTPEQDGLDLRKFLVWSLKRIWIVVLCAVLGSAGYTAYASKTTVPVYESKVSLYLAADPESKSSGKSVLADNRVLAGEIVEFFKEDRLLQAIAEQVDGTEASSIKGAFDADNPDGTALIRISAFSGTAQKAYDLAKSAGEQTIKVVEETLGVSNLIVFSEAKMPESAKNMKPANFMLLGIAIGAAAGLLILLLWYLIFGEKKKKWNFSFKRKD